MLKKIVILSALLSYLMLLTGCGQTGPLYLPSPEPTATPTTGIAPSAITTQTNQPQKKSSS